MSVFLIKTAVIKSLRRGLIDRIVSRSKRIPKKKKHWIGWDFKTGKRVYGETPPGKFTQSSR